jgi:hypothetical protein
MHPALLQLLAAEQTREKIEKAEDWRQAHQRRPARRPGRRRLKAQAALPRAQSQTEPPPAATAAPSIPAARTPRPSADGRQGGDLAMAERRGGWDVLTAAGRRGGSSRAK